MASEMDAERAICCRCGTAYGRKKGNFPVSYAALYRGSGYLPYCKNCVDAIYNDYVTKCEDPKKAVRQVCRKLDIYWHDTLYERVARKATTRTMMTNYIQASNNIAYAGKSYDDTLIAEGRFWNFGLADRIAEKDDTEETESAGMSADAETAESVITFDDIPEDVIAYWGPGYTPEMYMELEQRLQYYKGQMEDSEQTDLGAQMLLRQIAMLEIDINRARADGKSVDKMVSALNSLIASLKKPQRNAAADTASANTPFGVWIKRWEDERPLPEIDESMKDVDGIVKYVLTWVYGHLAHMLKIKNARVPLYEEAIARLRVEHPEYDEDDDETMIYDLFGDGDTDGGAE